jgi:hypothetical protein
MEQTTMPCVVPEELSALLTTLVSVFCYRYQSDNPWAIATGIRNKFECLTDDQKGMFHINLHDWYVSLYTAEHWGEMEHCVGLFQPPIREDRKCFVFGRNKEKSDPCMNSTDDHFAYCSFHLHILLLERRREPLADIIFWKQTTSVLDIK